MSAPYRILAAAVCGLLLGLPAAWAVSPIYLFVNMGTAENELTVHPQEITLDKGKLYQLVVSNPSETIHVVAAPELVTAVKTAELSILGPRLNVAAPTTDLSTGITLQPGQVIEWTFTPLGDGIYKFGCDDPAHAAAGMHTMIRVVSR